MRRKPITLEKDVEEPVCRYARDRGVMVRKYTSPQHRSVPDRLFVFDHGIHVYIEFKSPTGALSSGQEREINRLIEKRCYVYVINSPEVGIALVQAFIDQGANPPSVRFAPIPT